MHYLSKSKTRKQEKMAKFTKLWKLNFWHKTSSCKCSMCLYYVGKVSDSFSKSSGTSWFGCFSKSCRTSWIPHICTTYATLRITKGNNSNRIGPQPLIFYYKRTSYQYQMCLQNLMNFYHCHFKILKKNQNVTDGQMERRTVNVITVYPPPNKHSLRGV